MIKLYSFGPAFGLPDASPFVTKIDLYLRIFNIEFESVADVGNLRRAPKKKLPFIEDGDQIIADSTFIIDYLKQHYDADLDHWLTPEQRAIAQLVGKSLDENLYWCLVYSRWARDDTWPIIKQNFFSDLPFPLKSLVPAIVRRGTLKQLEKHGMGMHSDDEVLSIAEFSFSSLSDLLGDKRYFFGDQMSTLDVTAFAMVASFLFPDFDNPSNRLAKSYQNLQIFCDSINQEYYS